MRLPSFKRIFKKDYPQEFQATIEKLAFSINNAIESLNNALTKNINLKDNIYCTIRSITVQVDKTGKPLQSTSFSLDVSGNILGISVISAINQTNPNTYAINHPFISFTQQSGTVLINNISGLSSGTTNSDVYLIEIIAWA